MTGIQLLRGAAAGAAGWWVMDHVLRFLYNHEDSEVRRREDRARGGVPALEVLAEKGAGLIGSRLSDEERQRWGTILQWTTGIGAGMLYTALRSRIPAVRAGHGLAYGAAFSLVVDEGLTPLFGLSPGPDAFPWQTHARGFVGHLVFGMVAETALEWIDRVEPRVGGPSDKLP